MHVTSWLRTTRSMLRDHGRARCRPALEALEGRDLPSFLPPVAFQTDKNPVAAVAADFNGDGRTDLAVANNGANDVSVLLGKGDGTFGLCVNYPTDTRVVALKTADVNGDGRPDILAACAGGNDVLVWLNAGNGTFQGPLVQTPGLGPQALSVADLNGNGRPDLIVANTAGNNLSVSIDNGTEVALFQAPFYYAAGNQPSAVAVGDFNGDGFRDVAVANGDGNVGIFLNTGDGHLQAGLFMPAVADPTALAVGDFNADGRLDVAVTSSSSSSVTLLLGNGNGTFQAPLRYSTLSGAFGVVAADFNYDGRLDLAVSDFSSNELCLLAGKGDGTFFPSQYFFTGTNPAGLALGDFNGDRMLDVAVAANGSGTVNVLLNHRNWIVTGSDAGSPPDVRIYDAPTGVLLYEFAPYATTFLGGVRVATGDVNGDGIPDIITAPGPTGGPDIRVFDGWTGGPMAELEAYDGHFMGGVYVAAADLNHDGHADIITSPDASGGPDVRVFDGATGTLSHEFMAYDPHFLGGVRLAAGDVNGDGTADIITAPGQNGGPDVRVWDGKTYQLTREFMAYDPSFTGGVFVAAGDTNGDGKADILVGGGRGSGGQVKAFSGADGSLLASLLAYPSFNDGIHVGAADVNGDNRAELLTGPAVGGQPIQAIDVPSHVVLDSFFANDPRAPSGVFVGGC